MHLTAPADKGYPKNLLFSGLSQVILLVLSGFVADFGESNSLVLSSIAIFWAMMLFIFLRRRSKPAPGDLIFAKYGFFFVLFAFGLISSVKSNLMNG